MIIGFLGLRVYSSLSKGGFDETLHIGIAAGEAVGGQHEALVIEALLDTALGRTDGGDVVATVIIGVGRGDTVGIRATVGAVEVHPHTSAEDVATIIHHALGPLLEVDEHEVLGGLGGEHGRMTLLGRCGRHGGRLSGSVGLMGGGSIGRGTFLRTAGADEDHRGEESIDDETLHGRWRMTNSG